MTFTMLSSKSMKSRSQVHRILVPFLLALVPAFLSCAQTARADNPTAHLVVGGKEAPFEVPPFVGQDGQVYAPADFVRLLGADYTLDPAHQCLAITSADGKKFDQPYRVASERFMIPVESVASQLGAVTHWDASQRTMTLDARVLMVREDHNTLIIATSYPVYYRVDSLDDPARVFVDVFGATLPAAPAAIPIHGDNLLRIRSGQLDQDTVRLVLDLKHAIHYQVAATMQTNDIEVALNTDRTSTAYVPLPLAGDQNNISEADQAGASDDNAGASGDNNQAQQAAAPAPPADTQPSGDFKITDIEFKSDPSSPEVVITTVGAPPGGPSAYRAFLLDDPVRLAFDLPGATFALTGDHASDMQLPVSSPDISDIRWGAIDAENGALGRIVLDLAHTVAYNVTTQTTDTGNIYMIAINPAAGAPPAVPTPHIEGPMASTGSLAGKIVCIDPGHGGKDGGAPGIGGVWEKQLTLPIAKEVRAVLEAAGARVVMTREDDTFIPLTTRAQIGIDAHADYFISIHCDSGDAGRNSQEGTTVYYHGNNAVSRGLARSVSSRLAQLDDGIRADGIRTDYVRFPGIGFAVLRHSTEPAILVECGYVNNDQDLAHLKSPDVRHQIAQAIVAGLADYVQYRMASNP